MLRRKCRACQHSSIKFFCKANNIGEKPGVRQGKISILAPIGTAMLGYEVGDSFEWDVPAGKRRLLVKRILYQPEASGDYHL